jgi:hypothetical protein
MYGSIAATGARAVNNVRHFRINSGDVHWLRMTLGIAMARDENVEGRWE